MRSNSLRIDIYTLEINPWDPTELVNGDHT